MLPMIVFAHFETPAVEVGTGHFIFGCHRDTAHAGSKEALQRP